ncbi:MAG: hypothetical protein ACLFSY_01330 [Desulfonatronovibrionaceae bacterium]
MASKGIRSIKHRKSIRYIEDSILSGWYNLITFSGRKRYILIAVAALIILGLATSSLTWQDLRQTLEVLAVGGGDEDGATLLIVCDRSELASLEAMKQGER